MSCRRFGSIVGAALVFAACGRTSLDGSGDGSDPAPGDSATAGGAGGSASGGSGGRGGTGGTGSGGVAGTTGPGGTAGTGAGGTGVGGTGAGGTGAGGTAGIAGALIVLPRSGKVPLGQSVQLNGYLQRGTAYSDVTDQVKWSSDNAMVAAVSNVVGQQGRLSTVSEGQTTVRAGYLGLTTSSAFEVTKATLTSIIVAPPVAMLNVAMRRQMQATAVFSDRTQQDVSLIGLWRSSDPKVATVSNDPGTRGQVVAVASGKAQVTIDFAGTEASATVVVQAPVTLVSVAITPANPTAMVTGPPVELSLVASYSDGTTRNLTGNANWVSMNPMVARVMGGRVTCTSGGSVVISAGAMGQTATTTLSCVAVTLVSLYLVPGDTAIPKGMALQYYVFAHPASGMDSNVTSMATWSSSDLNVATVQNTGLQRGVVKTIGEGKTAISATYQGMTATATLTVTP
jgi:trimeric autotransporter adhesin